MFELLVFRPAFGEPTGSPFCVKAMCLLALAEAEWRPVVVDDPRRMPHGKLPVLRDGDRLIPDSEAIRAHLDLMARIWMPGSAGANGRSRAR